MLRQKNILLGVCGSIAAYKTALLVRHLVKEGARVRVIMTPAATAFISPLTLSTLSGHPVLTRFSEPETGSWNNHVELGSWADLLLIAPASANTLAKFAGGICDNLLSAVYLSAKCPVFLAPAMDLDMWKHPSTGRNTGILESFGNKIIPPGFGELASGLTGEGRLAEPAEIVSYINEHFVSAAGKAGKAGRATPGNKLSGKKILITAGPTHEAIDPVRFIGNHSTGTMGFALAEQLAARGAEVELVCGPVQLETKNKHINRTDVISAAEMYAACTAVFPTCDIAILSAAVSDYAPEKVSPEKIKKSGSTLSLKLIKNKDILAELGKKKKKGQLLVGFALETNNELENAREKLAKKNLDLIVLNSLREPGAGFGAGTNKVTLLHPDGSAVKFPARPKPQVAADIIETIQSLMT